MIRNVRIMPSCSVMETFLCGYEVMTIEIEAGLVVIRALGVVMKRSATPPAVHEMAKLILLPRPEALDPAALARCAPLISKEMTVLVKRRRELISAVPAAFGELVVPCQL
jgi:hypothetical protein